MNNKTNQILKLGNGSILEVHIWNKKTKMLQGKLIDQPGNISVYIPESYLAMNLPKDPKNTRKRYV